MASESSKPNRGVRNNNWLNIRYSSANDWMGQTGKDADGYAVFGDPVSGLRAADIVLRNYGEDRGIESVGDAIARFAPPEDNNPTSEYAKHVAGRMGVAVNDKINLTDPAIRESMIAAMVPVESPDAESLYAPELLSQARSIGDTNTKETMMANPLLMQESPEARQRRSQAQNQFMEWLKSINPYSAERLYRNQRPRRQGPAGLGQLPPVATELPTTAPYVPEFVEERAEDILAAGTGAPSTDVSSAPYDERGWREDQFGRLVHESTDPFLNPEFTSNAVAASAKPAGNSFVGSITAEDWANTFPSGQVAPEGARTFPMPEEPPLGPIVEIDAAGNPAQSWQERLFGFGGGDPKMNMMMTGLRMLSNAGKGQGFGQSLADAYIGQTGDARQLEAQSYARNFGKEQMERSERWEDKYAKELSDVESKLAQITDPNDPSYPRLTQRKQHLERLLGQRYSSGSLFGGSYLGGGAPGAPQGTAALLDALSQAFPR